jgi:hypothetical protein
MAEGSGGSTPSGRKEVSLSPDDFQFNDQGQLVIDKDAVEKAVRGTEAEGATENEAIKITITIDI